MNSRNKKAELVKVPVCPGCGGKAGQPHRHYGNITGPGPCRLTEEGDRFYKKGKYAPKKKPAKKPAKKPVSRKASRIVGKMSKLERQFKHILESSLDRGKPYEVAVRIAAATVNKQRAKHSRKGDGPKLVGKGGSRRQWYPGKGKETLVCLKHNRCFASKAALITHYRSHKKGK